jgi:hypothetical protein
MENIVMLTKEQVRIWMRQRQQERAPLPDAEQLRRELRACLLFEAKDVRTVTSDSRHAVPARKT